jgi:hypothetical protein
VLRGGNANHQPGPANQSNAPLAFDLSVLTRHTWAQHAAACRLLGPRSVRQRAGLWLVLLCVACSSDRSGGLEERSISIPDAASDHAVGQAGSGGRGGTTAGSGGAGGSTAGTGGAGSTADSGGAVGTGGGDATAGSAGMGGAPHQEPDAGPPIECGALQESWSAFVQANRACSTVSDCIVVGGAGTCDCGYNLGNGSGDAIAKSALERSRAYFTRYDECKAAGHNFACVWDAAPHSNLRCESGSCTVTQRSCIEFDSGRG